MRKIELINKIKNIEIVRVLTFSFVNFIRISRKVFYRFTKDADKIRSLKGMYDGKRCFIIGNGPSLTADDLELLADEYCFASNRIYYMFHKTRWRPKCFLCMDSNVCSDIKNAIARLDIPLVILLTEARKYHIKNKHVVYANNYYPYFVHQYKRVEVGFSQDVSKYFIAGETVTYNAIQLAVYMGFQEIYLVGVDNCYAKSQDARGRIVVDPNIRNYFDDLDTPEYSIQRCDTVNAAYAKAKEYCDAHGSVIKNATRGGKLEIFPRVSLEEVMMQQ